MDRVRLDDEIRRGLQPNGGPEIGEREGDGVAVVDIAGVAKKPYPSVGFVLDNRLLGDHWRG